MTTDIKLTDTQQDVLSHAADQPDGRITWFPEGVKGGARQKVLTGLVNKALITRSGDQEWFITAAGYDALGRDRPTPAASDASPAVAAAVSPTVANAAQEKADAAQQRLKIGVEGKPRTRENSKQATVLEMLQRPAGATILQIMEATGWQAHTVRGTFAGALKKKLGLNLTSDKPAGGERIYRIA